VDTTLVRLRGAVSAVGCVDGDRYRGSVAVAAVAAIHTGDLAALRRLLVENPWLATARLGDDGPEGMSRTLLHVVTDWPGHFPNGAATAVRENASELVRWLRDRGGRSATELR